MPIHLSLNLVVIQAIGKMLVASGTILIVGGGCDHGLLIWPARIEACLEKPRQGLRGVLSCNGSRFDS